MKLKIREVPNVPDLGKDGRISITSASRRAFPTGVFPMFNLQTVADDFLASLQRSEVASMNVMTLFDHQVNGAERYEGGKVALDH